MTEPIEKWKEEFHKQFALTSCVAYSEAHGFADHDVDLLWRGFRAAKRSQPVVELPYHGINRYNDQVYDADEIHEALTAAGIPYKIKVE